MNCDLSVILPVVTTVPLRSPIFVMCNEACALMPRVVSKRNVSNLTFTCVFSHWHSGLLSFHYIKGNSHRTNSLVKESIHKIQNNFNKLHGNVLKKISDIQIPIVFEIENKLPISIPSTTPHTLSQHLWRRSIPVFS